MSELYGLQQGIQYGQNARVEELNSRILERFAPEVLLKQNIDMRPVSTKYSRFPLIETVKKPTVDLRQYSDYSGEFAPTQGIGPINGFNANTESELRNQFFALQKAPQAVFIPSSNSDLYKVTMANPSRQEPQPFSGLFDKYIMDSNLPIRNADPKIGQDMFFNSTRTQLRI